MNLIRNIALSLILLSAVEASHKDVEDSFESLTRAAKQMEFQSEQYLYTTNLHLYRQGPCAGDMNRRLLHFSNMYKALQKLRTISLQKGNPFAEQANDILSKYNINKYKYRTDWEDYNRALLG